MAHWFDASKYQKYIVKMQGGKNYLTVIGQTKAAHDAGVLLGSETFVEYTDTHVRVKVRIKVLNKHLDNWDTLPEEAKIGYYDGIAESPLTGGKQAEATFPTEVCETSALGRAFAKFGLNLDSMATAEEMEQVATKKDSGYKTATQVNEDLKNALKSRGVNTVGKANKAAHDKFNKDLDSLTIAEINAWVKDLQQSPATPF